MATASLFGPPPVDLRRDVISGFLVSLIALPLCLGIAMASGFPPIGGVISAIIGGVFVSHLGSARLTIKGPAAGMIVIVIGAVTELGGGDMALGYQRALAVGVVAGVVQVIFALLKAGRVSDMMPPAVVHGMMAAIGVIIIAKQTHTVLGVVPQATSPCGLLAEVPQSILRLNPEVFLIGAIAFAIMIVLPRLPWASMRKIPAPMVVLAIAIPLGFVFDLGHEHVYALGGHEYHVGPGYLIRLPGSLLAALSFPDFSQITSETSIKYVAMFSIVGTIESLLSVSAVDAMDPAKRASNPDRDLLALGIGNTIAAAIGGLPMISEIVRSRANIDAGATSRWSNFFHGVFLLASVALLPSLLQNIPLAALGAMLIATGIRLASPKEFAHALDIGREQLALFLTTCIITLAEDLLVGVACGVALKAILHLVRGATVKTLVRMDFNETRRGDELVITIRSAAVFSNFMSLKARLARIDDDITRVVLDFADSPLVDHTVQHRLQSIAQEWEDRELVLVGLDDHVAASDHALAARRGRTAQTQGGSV
jgi:MFS superfamily sulfate permease-like transporter